MSIIVEALNRLQDRVQRDQAAFLVTRSAAESRFRARRLGIGAVVLAAAAMAGGLWLVRPHNAVRIPSLPAAAAETAVAVLSPAPPPSVGPGPGGPERPTPEVASERRPNAAVQAPPPALPSTSPPAVRGKEPIALAGALVTGTPRVKRLTPPPAATRLLPEDFPLASRTPARLKEPDPSLEMFRLGGLYQQAGDHRRAIEQYRALLAIDARHVPALNNLAVSLRHRGELGEAAEVLQRAIASDPTYDKAFTNLGVVYQLQERSDAAIEAYLRALAINGQNWESAFNLGLLFWEADDLERASHFFLKVVSLRSYAYAYYHLGLIAERQGRLNEALPRYRQALQEREGAQAGLRAEAERRLLGLLGQVRP